MKLLARIASVVVILVGLTTLYFTHKIKGNHDSLRNDKTTLTASLNTAKNSLLKTEGSLRDTIASLTTTSNKLVASETALDATNKVIVAAIEERDKAKTEAAAIQQQLQTATTEIASTKEALTKAQETIAAKTAEITKAEERTKQIELLAQENKVLGANLEAARSDIKRLIADNEDLRRTPINIRGQITGVEDRWDFVVLNIGQNQKVRPNTEFLVYRNNEFICKVLTLSISPNTSVAQILPEFQKDDPRPGDMVIH